MNGFYLKELRVSGDSVKAVNIIFNKGLNVINGPSNTGKSYVFQCIDYMFGAKKIKKIEQAKGYNTIALEIKRYSDDLSITLVRTINTNKIYYSYSNIDEFEKSIDRELDSEHDAKKDNNISKFLLDIIGITENKQLIKNASGKKKTLGFRGIANLTIIDEDKISSEKSSPVLDEEKTNNTYSKSLFRYLLTQQDDRECEELEKREIRVAKIQAKLDYITEEITKLEKKIEENGDVQLVQNDEEIERRIVGYREQVEMLEKQLENKRQDLAGTIREYDVLSAKNTRITMLYNRLQLLKRQYDSDISRLQFVQDGEEFLAQIQINECPLCKGKVNDFEEIEEKEKVITACNKEVDRIKMHLEELVETLEATVQEKEEINNKLEEKGEITEQLLKEIQRMLEESFVPLRKVLEDAMQQAAAIVTSKELKETIRIKQQEIMDLRRDLKSPQPKLTYEMNIEDATYTTLCEKIAQTLVDFGYHKAIVNFDVKEQDIVIDESPRTSNGKGFRAFFYTAFSLAIMDFLLAKDSPYSRVLILDSPLTTLKEGDKKEGGLQEGEVIDDALQKSFYSSLADRNSDTQIIIIDNKMMPEEIKSRCNHIEFTKDMNRGRYGFF